MTVQLAIEMPEPWRAFRTDPALREQELARALGETSDPQAEQFLTRLLDTVATANVVAMATLSFPPDVAPDVMAALTITKLDTPETLGQPELLGLADPDWSTSTMTTGAGTVVRQERLGAVPELAVGGYAPVVLSVRYLLPVPHETQLVALDCSTPCVAYTAEFGRLFDAAAATLRFVDGDGS